MNEKVYDCSKERRYRFCRFCGDGLVSLCIFQGTFVRKSRMLKNSPELAVVFGLVFLLSKGGAFTLQICPTLLFLKINKNPFY